MNELFLACATLISLFVLIFDLLQSFPVGHPRPPPSYPIAKVQRQSETPHTCFKILARAEQGLMDQSTSDGPYKRSAVVSVKDLCIENGDLGLVITRESEFGRQT